MNQLFKFPAGFCLIISLGIFLTSCKKFSTPVVTTGEVSVITQTSAVISCNVIDDGGSEITARGIDWGIAPDPKTSGGRMKQGKGTGSFSIKLSCLSFNTKYYVCAYATNGEGTSFGNEVFFTTNSFSSATLETTSVTSITSSTAVSGGNILFDGYGTITSKGVCWSKYPNPSVNDSKTEDGSGTDGFISNISGLEVNNSYYLRAYAINEAGAGYGNVLSFTTVEDLSQIIFNPDLTYGSVSDIDGNSYKTIKIGDQEWMAENLKTSRLTNGTTIFHDRSDGRFYSESPTYTLNDTYATYTNALGAYYNWYTVATGKLCPVGWHVPSYDDWKTLSTFLGGDSTAGGKLKETGTIHWKTPNTDASNETGFSALPGGYVTELLEGFKKSFQFVGDYGFWWSNAPVYDCCAWSGLLLYKNSKFIFYEMSKTDGCPVRCIKD